MHKKHSVPKTFPKKTTNSCKVFTYKSLLLIIVDPQGFEPRQAVPKTEVLPLHHGSVVYCGANLGLFF